MRIGARTRSVRARAAALVRPARKLSLQVRRGSWPERTPAALRHAPHKHSEALQARKGGREGAGTLSVLRASEGVVSARHRGVQAPLLQLQSALQDQNESQGVDAAALRVLSQFDLEDLLFCKRKYAC